ncbi:MAG: pilus assembly protein [Bdellovibrionales bacterium RBG_16_40_8]|nr:MAG: pilus assembly protein [Bdellovibrionales bacterium RBG_16_40_8]
MSQSGNVFSDAIRSFLSPIQNLLDDPKVTEVMINSFDEIWVEIAGHVKKTDAKFKDEDSLRAAVNNIAQSVGRVINDAEPRLDARLPSTGYRIHAVLPPCARKGTTVAIRKFSSTQMTFKDYVKIGALSVDCAQFLDISMKLGKNILVSGGTGSGKTTLLGVLCDRIPEGQRIIVIEDSSELKVDYSHVVFFETRMKSENGLKEVSIQDLLKSSLRLRPDRIIVGEVRGSEAMELIQAMNTGHKGCLGTVHANTSFDALTRLEALAQGSEAKVSERALRQQIASAIDLVVQVSRYSDGSRRLAEISEVRGFTNDGSYDVRQIYAMGRMLRKPDGKLSGLAEPTGELPGFMTEIEDNQIPFPRTKFQKTDAA